MKKRNLSLQMANKCFFCVSKNSVCQTQPKLGTVWIHFPVVFSQKLCASNQTFPMISSLYHVSKKHLSVWLDQFHRSGFQTSCPQSWVETWPAICPGGCFSFFYRKKNMFFFWTKYFTFCFVLLFDQPFKLVRLIQSSLDFSLHNPLWKTSEGKTASILQWWSSYVSIL